MVKIISKKLDIASLEKKCSNCPVLFYESYGIADQRRCLDCLTNDKYKKQL